MINMDDLDDDIILCNTCNSEYDEHQRSPKLLPCLHTLCKDCTLNGIHGSILRCSVCQQEHQLPGDLELLKDSTMSNMMDMIKIQRKSSSVKCSDCPDNNIGESFCKECYVFLCNECTSAHRRTQVTRRHVVLTLDEFKTSGIENFSRKEVCPVAGHEDQPFSFYCESDECQRPVCTQCVVGVHSQANGHAIRNLSEIYDDNKHMIERKIGELLNKIADVSSNANGLESETTDIVRTKEDVISEIDKVFGALETLIRERREKLKQRVEVICQQRRGDITSHLDILQKSKSDMENCCSYASRMLVFTNKPEFLQLKDTVLTKLENLVDSENEIRPLEPVEISFNAGIDQSRLEDIVNNIGEVTTNIYGDAADAAKVNGHTNEDLTLKLPYHGPPIHPPGKYTSNKFQSTPNKFPNMRPTKLVKPTGAKVEPLNLDGITGNGVNKSVRGVKTSPTEENTLGRPLSLKAPVISPVDNPLLSGTFSRDGRFNWLFGAKPPQSKVVHSKQESQDSAEPDSERERQLPKTPTSVPTAVILTKKSPVPTSPITPTFQPKSQTKPPSPTTPKYGMVGSTLNGGVTSSSPSYINNYPEVKQSTPSPRKTTPDKPVVFGDIVCPDFQMDVATAHHEREVTSDGRTLRNKKTELYGGGGGPADIENSLVQYKGAIGTHAFQDAGRYYYEVDVVYNIQQPLEETWLVFEMGVCRLDDVDMHHTVERHEFARSFYLARYPEDGRLTQEFWHNRDLLHFQALSDNTAGLEVRVSYGFLVDTKRKRWTIVDCNSNKVLYSFDMLDFTEALYPVFGCYNPDLISVEMTLKTGTDITLIPQCLKSSYIK